MRRIVASVLLLLFTAALSHAQTTIYWKRDYIRDANGSIIAVATPQPSDTSEPTEPTNVSAVANSSSPTTAIDITWSGSTDYGGSNLAGYIIYRGAIPVGAVGSSYTAFTDVGLTPNTTYSYRVVAFDNAYNYSSYSDANDETTNALPASPTGLTVTAASTSQINLAWNPPSSSGSLHHYRIWRKSGGDWTDRGTLTPNGWADTGLSSSTTYLYKIAAENSSNEILGWTNVDLATTLFFTDDTITVGSTVVKAVHITELRTAINAVRAAAALSAATWTNSSLSGAWIKAVDIAEMRTALGDALSVLGLPASNYTDTLLSGVQIKKAHIEELRQRTK